MPKSYNNNKKNTKQIFPFAKPIHCVKSVRIRSFSGLYFPLFGLNTEIYSTSLRIQTEFRKIPTRKSPNTDTFHAVIEVKEKQPNSPKKDKLKNVGEAKEQLITARVIKI